MPAEKKKNQPIILFKALVLDKEVQVYKWLCYALPVLKKSRMPVEECIYILTLILNLINRPNT